MFVSLIHLFIYWNLYLYLNKKIIILCSWVTPDIKSHVSIEVVKKKSNYCWCFCNGWSNILIIKTLPCFPFSVDQRNQTTDWFVFPSRSFTPSFRFQLNLHSGISFEARRASHKHMHTTLVKQLIGNQVSIANLFKRKLYFPGLINILS